MKEEMQNDMAEFLENSYTENRCQNLRDIAK